MSRYDEAGINNPGWDTYTYKPGDKVLVNHPTGTVLLKAGAIYTVEAVLAFGEEVDHAKYKEIQADTITYVTLLLEELNMSYGLYWFRPANEDDMLRTLTNG